LHLGSEDFSIDIKDIFYTLYPYSYYSNNFKDIKD